jgi:hypothetical protein
LKTRKEIEELVSRQVTPQGVKHISDMLEGIQEYIFYKKPTSKFMQLCSDENWKYAAGMGDSMNKEIVTQTTIFQDFVKMVKTSPEYVSKIREEKLNEILDKDEYSDNG